MVEHLLNYIIPPNYYTSRLEDPRLLGILAMCAEDVYDFDKKAFTEEGIKEINGEVSAYWASFAKGDKKVFDGIDGGELITWGLYRYESLKGPKIKETILAFRGTDAFGDVILDVSLMKGGDTIKRAIDLAVQAAIEYKATMICGHSLGGYLAEAVCAQTRLPGASFNAPGPSGHIITLADGS